MLYSRRVPCARVVPFTTSPTYTFLLYDLQQARMRLLFSYCDLKAIVVMSE
jgi:hypothetical protein